eukprot:TRINITY_DN2031_c0_g1_i3.p1 TRINITY_DN2031_c0_g1~~TRINITY_DN2031_c0_g1_i3.p1  ORF type:complete len:398 (+),score=86.04 TRINITY_DN2031_c0_g1_i3:105-1298(+)
MGQSQGDVYQVSMTKKKEEEAKNLLQERKKLTDQCEDLKNRINAQKMATSMDKSKGDAIVRENNRLELIVQQLNNTVELAMSSNSRSQALLVLKRAVNFGIAQVRNAAASASASSTSDKSKGCICSLVNVPNALMTSFFEVENLSMAYMDKIQSNPVKGEIAIDKERYILTPASSISYEFFRVIMRLFQNMGGANTSLADRLARKLEAFAFVRDILYELGKGVGSRDCVKWSDKLKLQLLEHKLGAGPVYLALTGWCSTTILPDSNLFTTNESEFVMLYEHNRSFEAYSWIEHDKEAKRPNACVCCLTRGYAAGWCSQVFGIDVDCVEVACWARGDSTCRFVVAPPKYLIAQVQRYFEVTALYTPNGMNFERAAREFLHLNPRQLVESSMGYEKPSF